ncbi:MAG: TRAM domain-containing protein [Acidobacteria bacterium]|nr:TRAM domain-containing protein [Acidobacteriota bacterium]
MMETWIIRIFFAVVLTYASFLLAPLGRENALLNLLIGFILAVGIILFELRLRRLSLKTLIGALIGSIAGIIGATLISIVLSRMTVPSEIASFLQISIILFMAYVGLMLGADKGNLLNMKTFENIFLTERQNLLNYKLLDTSVIIDGRIADVCETGFLEGVLIAPQFILNELQMIADSSDSIKRNRGRRGLDILQRIQKMSNVKVQILEKDYVEVKEVDLKLIELAREMNAKIVTNDFNLNKVAQLRGVSVLNINELANSLKPIVLPGEAMKVFILKEGKEENQGVAYLDDGTMVVVDDARNLIGKNVEIAVTSLLQTTAGKMIFGKITRLLSGGTMPDVGRNGRSR